jgi:cell division protein FtsL
MPKKKKAQPNGITFGMSMVTLMAVTIVLILTMVKIWMSNQIYHESKIVNSMTREVAVLKAEQVMLQQSVEALRFKNRVADTIFVINSEEER